MTFSHASSGAVALGLAWWAASTSAVAAFEFIDVAAESGIGEYVIAEGMGAGLAAADYDDDGDIDLFVPNGLGAPDQLYRNLGDGTVENVAAELGLDSFDNSRAALWLDYDGDGDLDLLVARDSFEPPMPMRAASTFKLYRHDVGGPFTDVTENAGLDGDLVGSGLAHLGGLAAGDVDNDGYLDIILTQWHGTSYLFHNNGDGTFTDISVSSGIAEGDTASWQPIMHDFDGDGFLDIFVAVDFNANHLWMNKGDLTFQDAAVEAGVDNAFNEMGVALGDYDADGDLDIYVTNIHGGIDDKHNLLYRNDTADGDPAFVDVAEDLGVGDTGWGWGTTFIDAACDGWLDIAATNGWDQAPHEHDRSVFFQNVGGDPAVFQDVATVVGFDDTDWGSCLITFDADRDGDLDMVQTCNLGGPLRLLRNDVSAEDADHHYLVVRPRMNGPNSHAIGAVVRVEADGRSQTRLITAGTSLLGQEPAEAFFGLGDSDAIESVTIEWPGGDISVFENIAVDQVITLQDGDVPPPCDADLDGDAAVGVMDLLALLAAWGPSVGHPADLDGDGEVGYADLLLLIDTWGPCE